MLSRALKLAPGIPRLLVNFCEEAKSIKAQYYACGTISMKMHKRNSTQTHTTKPDGFETTEIGKEFKRNVWYLLKKNREGISNMLEKWNLLCH